MGKLTKILFCMGLFSANVAFAQGILPDGPPVPKDNKITEAKIQLGKTLFFDPRLSVNGTLSCNSCHNVMEGGDDSRSVSVGVNGQKGERSSPTVWNAAFLSVQFWDGREPSLEAQAKGPLTNPIEMGMKDHNAVVEVVKKIDGYKPMFDQAFGKNSVNIDNIAKAIASFERTLTTANSPYDRCEGGQKKYCHDEAKIGLDLVVKTGCLTCHSGAIFAGPALPEGTGFFQKFPTFENNPYVKKYKLKDDLGRYAATKDDSDKHFWRVATWRNIALTAPYFHNGSVATLEEAVRVMAKTQLNKDLKDGDVKSIVAFLNSLTGEFPEITAPRLPVTPGRTVVIKTD